MTQEQFVIWLKGFSKAANPYNVTPAQWEAIVEELEKVGEGEFTPNYKDPAPTVFPKWYNPDHIKPIDPLKVNRATNTDKESISTNYEPWYNPYQPDFITTPGTSNIKVDGDVKTYNLNSNTATALRYPHGTSINYTNSQKKKQQLND